MITAFDLMNLPDCEACGQSVSVVRFVRPRNGLGRLLWSLARLLGLESGRARGAYFEVICTRCRGTMLVPLEEVSNRRPAAACRCGRGGCSNRRAVAQTSNTRGGARP